jgi:signal peptidase I
MFQKKLWFVASIAAFRALATLFCCLPKAMRMAAAGLIAAGFSTVLSSHSANATNYYVSSITPATTRDGRSWQRPWADMNQINWAIIRPGDVIEIDAGSTGNPVIYRAPLIVQKAGNSLAQPITIRVSNQAGHNAGVATIRLPNTTLAAIDLRVSRWVRIEAPSWRKLCLEGSVYGILNRDSLDDGAYDCTPVVRNVEIRATTCGIRIMSGGMKATQLVVHDNGTNIVTESKPQYGRTQIERSWIYNRNTVATNGVVAAGRGLGLKDCIVGPGLSNGVWRRGEASAWLEHCLFINAKNNNLVSENSRPGMVVWKCTSFMTPLNVDGQAHACLHFAGNSDWPALNIFVGGVVQTEAQLVTNQNYQWKVSGNLFYLSDRLESPFYRDQEAIPSSVANSEFCDPTGRYYNLIYHTRGDWGSTMKSIPQLLGTNQ